MIPGLLLLALMTLLAACSSLQLSAAPAQMVAGGDPQQGALAIQKYGCGSCHNIPGISGAGSLAAPPLDGWSERRYISGKLPNEPSTLMQWVRFPQELEPGSAMPNLGVTEEEARDISAYLFSLTGD